MSPTDLNHWLLCYSAFIGYHAPPEQFICERYLDGIAMVARTDSHMDFSIHSVVAFYFAMKESMKLYGSWIEGSFGAALKAFAATTLKRVDEPHFDRLIEVGESVNSGKGVPHAMTLNDVGVMKTLCDAYLLSTFQRLGPKGIAAAKSRDDNSVS